jgi:hypothetical protein
MFSHLHYVPILKWRLGEYQALSRLDTTTKERVTPLLEIPPVGFDFEKKRLSKTLDNHLKDFGRRLKSKWGARYCFVDVKHLDANETLADGSHPLKRAMQLARENFCSGIPVVSLSSTNACRTAAAETNILDQRGAAIRISLDDFDRNSLSADIDRCLTDMGVKVGSTDLIIDLCDQHFLPVTAFAQTLITSLGRLTSLNRWRTFTIVGSSYPKTIQDIATGDLIPRKEWSLYCEVISRISKDTRIPTFGDYCVANPDVVELDMRLIKPFAKLRYTTSESWYIAKGSAVRTAGFEQYRNMCNELSKKAFFDGPSFSEGDRYISECAAGRENTGNLTTWVWVACNRHITRAVADISSFHGA